MDLVIHTSVGSLLNSPPSSMIRFGDKLYRVGVIDDFETPSIDIDGDGAGDLSHGEVIERLIRGYVDDVDIVRYAVDFEGKETYADSLEETGNGLLKQITAISEQIAADEEPLDAVNFSIGVDAPLNLGTEVPYVDVADGEDAATLSADNLDKYRDHLLTWAFHHSKSRYKLMEALQNIAGGVAEHAQRFALYMGAGNSGPEHYSFLSLIDGQVSVGANNNASDPEIAPYSGVNALVDRFEQGTFGVQRVSDGFDITGDGVSDVADSEVSGGEPAVSRFVGQSYDAVGLSASDIAHINGLQESGTPFHEIDLIYDKLFPVKAVERMRSTRIALRTKGPEVGMWIRQEGPEGVVAVFKPGFTVDPETRIVSYDPDESGRPNLVSHIFGTSFSAPKALAMDLNQLSRGVDLQA